MIWFRKKAKGLQSQHPALRESLFADAPLQAFAEGLDDDPDTPAARFLAALGSQKVGDVNAARKHLHELLGMPELDARLRLQAWCSLRELGENPTLGGMRVRGLVVDLGTEAGLETFAAYEDHTAVVIARNGAVVEWATPECGIDDRIEALLTEASRIVDHTGPHHGPRENPPEAGHACISVLTWSGIHVGTGPIADLERDALGGPVLQHAATLLREVYARGAATHGR